MAVADFTTRCVLLYILIKASGIEVLAMHTNAEDFPFYLFV